MDKLTAAQLALIKQKAFGVSDKQAAEALHISEAALQGRRSRILYHTHSQNMTEAVYKCAKLGYI